MSGTTNDASPAQALPAAHHHTAYTSSHRKLSIQRIRHRRSKTTHPARGTSARDRTASEARRRQMACASTLTRRLDERRVQTVGMVGSGWGGAVSVRAHRKKNAQKQQHMAVVGPWYSASTQCPPGGAPGGCAGHWGVIRMGVRYDRTLAVRGGACAAGTAKATGTACANSCCCRLCASSASLLVCIWKPSWLLSYPTYTTRTGT